MLPFFPPNKQQSGHVASFMHSCIKSTATRENRPSVRAVCALEQRLTILIVKVIKPINAVLCAACHWVDCTLYFCRPFHEHYENDKICNIVYMAGVYFWCKLVVYTDLFTRRLKYLMSCILLFECTGMRKFHECALIIGVNVGHLSALLRIRPGKKRKT